jgi:hypothetical protein
VERSYEVHEATSSHHASINAAHSWQKASLKTTEGVRKCILRVVTERIVAEVTLKRQTSFDKTSDV